MDTSIDAARSGVPIARLPMWLRISGVIVFAGSAIFEARLIWEQTVWTWERGPQMVGFSLAHGAGAILLVFPLLLVVWTAVVIVLVVRSKMMRSRIAPVTWTALGLAVSLFVVGEVPDGFWQRVFIDRMAASPRAGDLLSYAAYRGDLGTVRGLISRGVPVDATDHFNLRTAMHGAAARGDVSILRYLLSKGGNVNALDRFGDSPVELAATANRVEAITFLTEQGARRIRGDETQREKAIHDQVRESIDELDREEGANKELQDDIKKVSRDEEIQRNSHNDNSH